MRFNRTELTIAVGDLKYRVKQSGGRKTKTALLLLTDDGWVELDSFVNRENPFRYAIQLIDTVYDTVHTVSTEEKLTVYIHNKSSLRRKSDEEIKEQLYLIPKDRISRKLLEDDSSSAVVQD